MDLKSFFGFKSLKNLSFLANLGQDFWSLFSADSLIKKGAKVRKGKKTEMEKKFPPFPVLLLILLSPVLYLSPLESERGLYRGEASFR